VKDSPAVLKDRRAEWSSAIFVASEQEVSNQGNSQCEWNEEKIFHECRPLLEPIAGRVGLIFLRGNHGVDVLQEIDATFFARASVSLLVVARRALVTQSCMAARAKPRDVPCFGAAFGAIHSSNFSGFEPAALQTSSRMRPQR
jgi:hypothetical protein